MFLYVRDKNRILQKEKFKDCAHTKKKNSGYALLLQLRSWYKLFWAAASRQTATQREALKNKK
jgi:hypothetical protein